MKSDKILLYGALAVGAYLFYQSQKGSVPIIGESGIGGFPSGYSPGSGQDAGLFNANTRETQPVSADFKNLIFTPTTSGAADRFIIAPGSGGAGVYDRYAQQSIRTETATQRAIFSTPGVVAPKVLQLFKPNQSIMK